MNKIYFIRHSENYANITKEFSYKKVDYSLTENGILQTQQTADFFMKKNIHFIYSSPLKRAYETAKIISDSINVEYSIIEELREINVGDLENFKPNKELWDDYLNIISDWRNGKFKSQFPDGENFYQVLERLKSTLSNIIRNINNNNILIIGHGGLFSVVIPYMINENNIKLSLKNLENCSISELNIENLNSKLIIEIISWGNINHLYGKAKLFISGLPNYKT